MRQIVTVQFVPDQPQEIALHVDLPAMPAEQARRWLDEQFVAYECEPLRASGKASRAVSCVDQWLRPRAKLPLDSRSALRCAPLAASSWSVSGEAGVIVFAEASCNAAPPPQPVLKRRLQQAKAMAVVFDTVDRVIYFPGADGGHARPHLKMGLRRKLRSPCSQTECRHSGGVRAGARVRR